IGIGNGVAIAAAFALRYSGHPLYRGSLRSLVSLNGFVAVDAQLAAVLHASINAFNTFPPLRPDLPVSYFARYIFSEEYLQRVDLDLALNIYTAVSSPISIEGRRTLCQAALLHEDLGHKLGSLSVPLVLLQGTEDMLVNPANVDPFLKGRSTVKHFWSHEFENASSGEDCSSSLGPASPSSHRYDKGNKRDLRSVYGSKGLAVLMGILSNPYGAFVAWVPAGHEVRQEAKRAVMDLLDALAKPTPEYTGVSIPGTVQHEETSLNLYPPADSDARNNCHKRPRRHRVKIEKVKMEEKVEIKAEEEKDMEMEVGNGLRAEKKNNVAGLGGVMGMAGMQEQALWPWSGEESIPCVLTTCSDGSSPPSTTSVIKRRQMGKVGGPQQGGQEPRRPKDKRLQFSPRAGSGPAHLRAAINQEKDGTAGFMPKAEAQSEVMSNNAKCGQGRPIDNEQINKSEQSKESIRLSPAIKEEQVNYLDSYGEVLQTSDPDLDDNVVESFAHITSGSLKMSTGRNELGEHSSFLAAVDLYPATTSLAPDASQSANPAAVLDSALQSPVMQQMERPQLPTQFVLTSKPGGLNLGELSIDHPTSNPDQRRERSWTRDRRGLSESPVSLDFLAAEICLEKRLAQVRTRQEEKRQENEKRGEELLTNIDRAQKRRRESFAAEDRAMLATLEHELSTVRDNRVLSDMQRAVYTTVLDDQIVRSGAAPSAVSVAATSNTKEPIQAMPPLEYRAENDLPQIFQHSKDMDSIFRDIQRDEEEMRFARKGLKGDKWEPTDLKKSQEFGKHALLVTAESDIRRAKELALLRVQPVVRGYLGRRRAQLRYLQLQEITNRVKATIRIQATARGRLDRKRVEQMREEARMELVLGSSAACLQRAFRGMLGRKQAQLRRQELAASTLERVFRGYMGRQVAQHKRAVLEELRNRNSAAVSIQKQWRCKAAVDRYNSTRLQSLASREIQRVYRGVLGRRKVNRRRVWETSAPGPERLKLGVRLIEDSK
ncbi:unnamed protein product, partial [Choristocarpus tenellus]